MRGSYARDEALAENLSNALQLAELTSVHRLLRVEEQGTVARSESQMKHSEKRNRFANGEQSAALSSRS